MRETKILCWNVNGIRAAAGKGFLEWLHRESPDILCLQETKAQPDQLSKAIRDPGDYHAYWNYPDQKGYSGVATLSREKPLKAQTGFGVPQFDSEGRTIVAEFPGFTVLNIYFPNGKKDGRRLQYKMDFYEAFADLTIKTSTHCLLGPEFRYTLTDEFARLYHDLGKASKDFSGLGAGRS